MGEGTHVGEGQRELGAADPTPNLPSREPTWGRIPGPWDHDVSQTQMLNRLRHTGTPLFL